MTKRQLAILEAAQRLFLERGYHGTSTKTISKHANVSEALIFKHFKSKDTLLAQVIDQCDHGVLNYLNSVDSKSEPKAILSHVFTMPFALNESNDMSLSLLSTLKLPHERELKSFRQLSQLLERAFEEEFYKSPKAESQLAQLIIQQISIALNNNAFQNKSELKAFVLKKYHIESE